MGNTPELSIGALSTAVGIPVGTLRTWERRYGVPKSDRLPSGHRRYSVDVVEKLLLVRDLLQRGHRPSALLRSNVQELQRLRGALGGDMARSAVVRHRAGDGRFEEWFEALASADADALSRILHESWARYGYVSFLDDHLGPFLVEVGLRWTTG